MKYKNDLKTIKVEMIVPKLNIIRVIIKVRFK